MNFDLTSSYHSHWPASMSLEITRSTICGATLALPARAHGRRDNHFLVHCAALAGDLRLNVGLCGTLISIADDIRRAHQQKV